MQSPVRLLKLLVSVLALVALTATTASAAVPRIVKEQRHDAVASAFKKAPADLNIPVKDPGPPPGAQVLKYKFGPMTIQPGQNLIDIDVQKERPAVDGWIVGFRPGLSTPRPARTRRSPRSTCTTRSGSSTSSRRSPPARRRRTSTRRRATAGATRPSRRG